MTNNHPFFKLERKAMSDCGCSLEIKDKSESRVLIILLVINAVMFFIEIIIGVISESTALIADSLDMLADATVYGIALYAVGKAAIHKINVAYACISLDLI